jgi:hypothetical protein
VVLPVYPEVWPVYPVVFSSRMGHHPVKNGQNFETIWKRVHQNKKVVILIGGGLLETQKGLNPVWLQTASGSLSIFLTASVTSISVS